MSSLYTWYKGQNLEPILEKVTGIPCQNEKDDDKAEEFLTFLLDEKTNATEGGRYNKLIVIDPDNGKTISSMNLKR